MFQVKDKQWAPYFSNLQEDGRLTEERKPLMISSMSFEKSRIDKTGIPPSSQ